MRNFTQFCRKGLAMTVLVLVLAYSALAGTIPFPGVVDPPPPQSVTGDIQYPGVASRPETVTGEIPFPGVAADSVGGIALTLWQSVLAFF